MTTSSHGGSTSDAGRGAMRTVLLTVGAVLMVAGVAGIAFGFAGFLDAGEDQSAAPDQLEPAVGDGVIPDVGVPETPNGSSDEMALLLFGLGGLGVVVGLGAVAFARAEGSTAGGYSRVVIEHGIGSTTAQAGIGCPDCGHLNSRGDRFCGGCGRTRA